MEEEKDLLDNIDKCDLAELAKKHGRTKGAIESKLKKLYSESLTKKDPIVAIESIINVGSIKHSVEKTKINNTIDNTLNIYILKCQHDKFYIGKSKNIENRIVEHFQQCGSIWTNLHKPIKVVDIIKNADSFDEDKYTKIYMAKYGIDNVRGGSYVQITLDDTTRKYLEKEINSTYDYCHRCGRTDHFIGKCNAEYHIDGKQIVSTTPTNNPSAKISTKSLSKPPAANHITQSHNTCIKCGRKGHQKDSCYAKKHVKGYYLK